MSDDLVIVKLEHARTMLMEAKTIQATKLVVDMASAAGIYAKRQQLGEEAIAYAHSVKIEALAQLGRMLKDMEKASGGQPYQKKSTSSNAEPVETPPTLAELGIDKKTSMVAQQLAGMPQELRENIANREKSFHEVRREMHTTSVREAPPFPDGKYRVLYADPPWKYGDQLTEDYGGTQWHYPSMSIAELCALPIEAMAQDEAVLFLWVTSPLLYEAFPVIGAWGFKYKACFVWDKVKHNMGHYNSVRHEFLLVCTRGSCQPDVAQLVDSVQSIERSGKHSEKPQEFRALIDASYPYGNRIELFARQAHEGWEAWGNERL